MVDDAYDDDDSPQERRGPRYVAWVLVVLVLISAFLLLSGRRLLVWETRVNPGDNYVVAGWGNLGTAGQAQLACRYFTGRSVVTHVLWYSPNNFLGRDQCPFFEKEEL